MASNASARYRQRLLDRSAAPDGLPEWLRAQYSYDDRGNTGQPGAWSGPSYVMRDSRGREVVLLNDQGEIDGPDLQFNDFENTGARWDEDLGWVTDVANVNQNQWERRHRRQGQIAMGIMGGAALAGLAGLGAAGGAGAAGAGEGLAATIPADLAVGGGAAGSSIPLAEMPAIVGADSLGAGAMGAGGGGAGLAGLGEAAGSGGLAAQVPADLAYSTGVPGGGASVGLDAAPAIQQAGGGGFGSLVDSVGGWGNVARLGVGLAGLGAAAGGRGSGDAGETNPQNIIEQMANANRVDHNSPFGSRRWSQDPESGRWTVTDALSPTEQANFEGVQGINSGVTNMTRDYLARMMAAGPRQRYDRPLGT